MKCKYRKEGLVECDGEAKARGLCRTHYAFIQRMIKAGLMSWQKLEAKGLAKPVKLSALAIKIKEMNELAGDGPLFDNDGEELIDMRPNHKVKAFSVPELKPVEDPILSPAPPQDRRL